MLRRLLPLVRQPIDDYLAALNMLLSGHRYLESGLIGIAALLVSWWIYVPLHELAHAFGCLLGGGTVTRLDVNPLYGAALLQRVFPFVHVGSEYAGQLTGFDTRGSDVTYLLTDFLPFVGTIVVGVPMLRAAGVPGWRPGVQAALFAAALPVAFAPFISLTGDYYEMGSILVSRAVATVDPSFPVGRWRGDDLFLIAPRVFAPEGGGGTLGDALGLALSFLVGTVLALLTYAAGTACARLFVRERSRSQPQPA
jgi:hypothetical protein